MDSTSFGGDDDPKYAGNGRGGDDPMKESESTVERSEGGACEESWLARTLDHIKRSVPVVASGAPWTESSVEIDCFLVSESVATEACLEGSIKPWHASIGVGGTLLRLGCRTRFFPFGEPFSRPGWIFPSLLKP